MEELKNNETSEKKERIDPLEVITLEGDENQVAEEKEDSPVIRRGDIYSFEDQEWRVFDVRDKNVLVSAAAGSGKILRILLQQLKTESV